MDTAPQNHSTTGNNAAYGQEGGRTIKKKKTRRENLYRELQEYEKAGIALWLNGMPSTPREIAKACTIGEEDRYMRDYIRDEEDGIKGIGFDIDRKSVV